MVKLSVDIYRVKKSNSFNNLIFFSGSTSGTLQELLAVLAEETGRNIPTFALGQSQAPITEEDILNR